MITMMLLVGLVTICISVKEAGEHPQPKTRKVDD